MDRETPAETTPSLTGVDEAQAGARREYTEGNHHRTIRTNTAAAQVMLSPVELPWLPVPSVGH